MVNSIICSWILNVVGPKLHTNIAYEEMARDMWINLQKRYAVGNTPKIHQLKTDLAACKQGELDGVDFYSKLSGMWSKLDGYTKVSYCTCGTCECKVSKRSPRCLRKSKPINS